MIAGLEKTGDIRKVDRNLFHPLFFEVPCPFLMFPPESVCAQLAKDERREFAYTVVNIMWISIEHQLSLPNPMWLQQDSVDPDQFLHDLFPEEVRDLLTQAKGPFNTLSKFLKAEATYREAEQRLFQERVKHNHINQPSYRKNFIALENNLHVDPEERLTSAESTEKQGTVPKDTSRYLKFPFFFYVARSQGKPLLVWIEMVHD